MSTAPSRTDAAAADPDAFIQMVSGLGHSCGLRLDGEVWCWGDNRMGELGLEPAVKQSVAKRRVVGLEPVVQLAAGTHHTCALDREGGVSCWGASWHGQLGNGQDAPHEGPGAVVGIDDATLITAGEEHTCVLRSASRAIVCWGQGRAGQLGGDFLERGSSLPVVVADGRDVVQLVSARETTCARTSHGRVSCWGGWEGAPMPEPREPVGARGVAHLSADQHSICALGPELGTLCWAANDLDRAIDDPQLLAPVDGPALLGSLAQHCIIREHGQAQCWRARAWEDTPPVERIPLPAGARVLSLTHGQRHACASLASGETLCWGDNALGQLGGARVTSATANPWAETTVTLVDDRFVCEPGQTRMGEAGVEQWCTDTAGRRQGPSVRYHPNGQLAASGRYAHDRREGRWRSWHPSGDPAKTGAYRDGLRQGVWIVHAGQGGWRGSFEADQPHGSWRYETGEGVAVRELEYEYGEARRWVVFDHLGHPRQQLERTSAGEVWTAWTGSGRSEAQVQLTTLPSWSIEDATWQATLPEGIVLDGPFRRYTSEDVLVEQGRHERRLKVGMWERWYEGGELREQTEYAVNHRHGDSRAWHRNGQPSHEGRYAYGSQDDRWTRWYEDGQLRERGVFEHGAPVGTWRRWYVNGQLREHRNYASGSFSTWYEDGQRRARGRRSVEADLDTKPGLLGMTLCAEAVQALGMGGTAASPALLGSPGLCLGQAHGLWQLWWADGSLAAKGRYHLGTSASAWRYRDEAGTTLQNPCGSKALVEMFEAEQVDLGCVD